MARLTRCALGAACLAASTFIFAAGQTSANYAMPRDTINAGVADMSSANFRLASSVGDAVATGTITSVSFRLKNGFRADLSASPAVLNLLSVVSRKVHGAATFNLTIDHTQLITGAITVEPRLIGSGHTLVFNFNNTVTSIGAATALDAMLNSAGAATAVLSGSDVVVTLTNVTDNKRLTLTLSGLNGSDTASASMGFLVGDVTNSRAVNAADISAVKANLGNSINSTTYKFDLNVSGAITSSDVSAVKARSGLVIP